MSNKLSRIIVVILVIASTYGCGQADPNLNARTNDSLPKREVESGPPTPTLEVTVKSVGIYAWWWSEEQLAKGVYRQKTMPPKNTYIKIEEWTDTGDADVPHPDLIDVVFYIENNSTQSANYVVSTVGDFKVESHERMDSDKSGRTVDELLQDVPWTEERSIGRVVIRRVAPKETREVKVKNFDLKTFLHNNYSDEKNGVTWPWKMRVRVNVETADGKRITQGEAIITIIPHD